MNPQFYLVLILSLNTSFYLNAQPDTIDVEEPIDSSQHEIEIDYNAEGLISWEESEPEFPGGEQALMQFIGDNFEVPQDAACIQGMLYLQFWIEVDGSTSEPSVLRCDCAPYQKAAIEMLAKMPKWSPGTFKNEPIRVKYTLPVCILVK